MLFVRRTQPGQKSTAVVLRWYSCRDVTKECFFRGKGEGDALCPSDAARTKSTAVVLRWWYSVDNEGRGLPSTPEVIASRRNGHLLKGRSSPSKCDRLNVEWGSKPM